MSSPPRRLRLADLLFGVFVVVCLAAVTWPGYHLVADRLEPRILGLPPTFVWNIAWVTASFFALLSYHLCSKPSSSAGSRSPGSTTKSSGSSGPRS